MIVATIVGSLALLSFGYTLGALSSPRASLFGFIALCVLLWVGGGLLIFS